jgi:hypothetical protein
LNKGKSSENQPTSGQSKTGGQSGGQSSGA